MFRRLLSPFNPFSRTALALLAWTHRRTVLRWGRSLLAELRRPGRIDPGRLTLIAKVLWAITSDERLAGARQLRQVELDGDVLVVDARPRWRGRARLVEELSHIEGISGVVDATGRPLTGPIDVQMSSPVTLPVG